MPNPWLTHVADYRKKHPNLSYKQVLTQAKASYSGSTKAPKKTVKSGSKTTMKTGKGKGKRGKIVISKNKIILKRGGNPLAGVAAVGDTVGNLANSIGDQIDKGRRTTHEINKENGYIKVEQKRNIGNEEREHQAFYRDLIHQRYWDPEKLKPSLRLPFDRKYINDPKYKKQRDIADDKLYAYAEKVFGRA
jgi:hypothetical protein